MTINREAAELMALRLTNAADAAFAVAEALRLATASLQETNEVVDVFAPVLRLGTATLDAGSGPFQARGVLVHRALEPDAFLDEDGNAWGRNLLTEFVPDPDTAALRAEVERLGVERDGYRNDAMTHLEDARRMSDRADAAEARLARVNGPAVSEALTTAYAQIHNQDPLRKYAVSEVKQIVYPLISLLEEFGAAVLPPVWQAADEQAAEGEATCACKTSNSACRAGCTHERVIDRTCPVHGEKVSDG